jgi:hypothetical protein
MDERFWRDTLKRQKQVRANQGHLGGRHFDRNGRRQRSG